MSSLTSVVHTTTGAALSPAKSAAEVAVATDRVVVSATARAGFATAVLGRRILVVGGEGNNNAYDTVEAYNTSTNSWHTLEPMPTARHGIQAVVCNGGVYVAAGGTVQGGSNPTDAHEVFFLGVPTSCGA